MDENEVSESEDTVTSIPEQAAEQSPEPIKLVAVEDPEPIKRRPGRPKGSKNAPVAAPEPAQPVAPSQTAQATPSEQKPASKPASKPEKGNPLNASESGGFFSSKEHKARCARMLAGAPAAMPLGYMLSALSTSVMQEVAIGRHLRAKIGNERTDEYLNSLPKKESVELSVPTDGGKVQKTNVAEIEAQAYAAIIAYVAPVGFDDPLVSAIAALAFSNAAYMAALRNHAKDHAP